MQKATIIGIVLVKNEEYFIEKAIRSVIDFCDRIIVADNLSTDSTFTILEKLAQIETKIEVLSLSDRTKSQDLIKNYASTPTWIFGVDGDEIYDPAGLKIIKEHILSGKYHNITRVFGNVLNCSDLDLTKKIAKGYLSPPCRSMTKLYNFSLVEDWSDPGNERLHGMVKYKQGFSENDFINISDQYSWEESPFRCLHLCFLRRSRQDANYNAGQLFARNNISDLNRGGLRTIIKRWVCSLLRINEQSSWKLEKYSRGILVEKDISSFF